MNEKIQVSRLNRAASVFTILVMGILASGCATTMARDFGRKFEIWNVQVDRVSSMSRFHTSQYTYVYPQSEKSHVVLVELEVKLTDNKFTKFQTHDIFIAHKSVRSNPPAVVRIARPLGAWDHAKEEGTLFRPENTEEFQLIFIFPKAIRPTDIHIPDVGIIPIPVENVKGKAGAAKSK